MAPRLIRPGGHRLVPWKNGRGVIADVLTLPLGAGHEDFDLRVALAPLTEEGPFSSYAGIDRWITRLSAARVRLEFEDGTALDLARLAPARFDSGLAPVCRLPDGEGRVLNVMTRRPGWSALAEAASGAVGPGGEGELTVLHVAAGRWAAAGLVAEAGDTLVLPGGVGAAGAGEAVLARVTPRAERLQRPNLDHEPSSCSATALMAVGTRP